MSLQHAEKSEISTLDDPVDMHILNRLNADETTRMMFRVPGLPESGSGMVRKGPYGSFMGSSPQGQVSTVSYQVAGVNRYFLVKQHGNMQELSEQQMSSIKEHLGIP